MFKMKPKARKLLEKVKAHILDEPNRLVMCREIATLEPDFADKLDGFSSLDEDVIVNPPCKTAGCIAGWTVMLAHPETKPEDIFLMYNVSSEAANLLGLDNIQIDLLYYTHNWPKEFYKRFKTKNLKKRAQACADRIDHFIETGE